MSDPPRERPLSDSEETEERTPGPSDETLVQGGTAVSGPDLGLTTVAREVYSIEGEIGRGGMGRVLAARDRRLGRPVALKELSSASPELARRFEREALTTARLQHPSIVSVLEAGRWPTGEPFYAMEHVTGRPLDKAVGTARSFDERDRRPRWRPGRRACPRISSPSCARRWPLVATSAIPPPALSPTI